MDSTLQVEHLSKTFGTTTVLKDAGIDLRPGEVHALLGHNGSGKSTLIKALAGVFRPDPGSRALYRGQEVSLDDPVGGWRRNLRFIHQDLGLVPTLSAAENLALVRGFDTRLGRIRWREERRKAEAAVRRFGGGFDVSRPVGTLPRGAQSILAIARAFEGLDADAAPVIILDEPTAALSHREVDILFNAVRGAVDAGAAVMLVSHRLNDVVALADRTTVLRDGEVVIAGESGRRTKADLIDILVGPGAGVAAARAGGGEPGAVVAEFKDVRGDVVEGVSIEVHRGSIVGVAGLDGSGREELAGLLFAAERATSPGSLVVEGRRPTGSGGVLARRAGAVALIPADRKGQGLIAGFSIRENLTLASLSSVTRRGRLRHGEEKRQAARWIDQLGIRPPQPEARTSLLSGGNAQKVQVAKALRLQPRVLVADEPTAGVDVGSKAQIYRDLAEVAEGGVGVVVVSSDTEELALLCDRVLVMTHGRVAGELHGAEISEEAIHRLAHQDQ